MDIIRSQSILILSLSMILFSSCEDPEPMVTIDTPDNYEFLRNGESTVSFEGQTTRIGMATELIEAMNVFDSSESLLLEMYSNQTASGGDANPFNDSSLNESTKSVKSKVAASLDYFGSNTVESAQIKADIESWIKAQVSDVFPNQSQLAAPGVAGQIADGSSARYINNKGLEYNQAVGKSLIGALMVDQMLNNYLGTSVLDESDNVFNNDEKIAVDGKPYTNMEHKWDEAYGYIFGAEGTNFEDPIETLGEDNFLNKYLSRVDSDEDFAGIANDIFQAFKLGRAAIIANEYKVRNEQVDIIRTKVSEVIAIRSIYYLQQGKLALENNDFGGAFHDLSEGFGFIYSLRFLRNSNSNNPYFTRAEVDGFINQLMAGNGFWDVDSTTLDQISDDIASRFNFTVAQAAN